MYPVPDPHLGQPGQALSCRLSESGIGFIRSVHAVQYEVVSAVEAHHAQPAAGIMHLSVRCQSASQHSGFSRAVGSCQSNAFLRSPHFGPGSE